MKTHAIGDTGMKLPGAPKDRAKKILGDFDIDTLNTNLADTLGVDPEDLSLVQYDQSDRVNHLTLEEWQSNLTKAKVWPSPDYGQMAEAGIPYPAVAALKAVYDALPTKTALPTPTNIAEMAAIFAEGIQLEKAFVDTWQPLADYLKNQPPSFQRVADHWVTALDICGFGDKGRWLEDVTIAKPLKADPQEDDGGLHGIIAEGMARTEHILAGFKDTADRLKEHVKGYYGISMSSRIFNAFRRMDKNNDKLSMLVGMARRDDLLSDLNISGVLQLRSIRNLKYLDDRTPEENDLILGYRLPVFGKKMLGKNPKILQEKLHRKTDSATPEAEQPSEPQKPRRPIRLDEAETQALLHEVDTESLRESPEYQSFTPLVEAGIVRGAQIGNWVTQKERPALVKKNYDAIISLTRVTGITPSLFALGDPISVSASDEELQQDAYDGKQGLGLAFGARGRSKASAHFEPSLFIINLTRKKGAGSLAHEWMHALDFRLGSLLDKRRINSKYHSTDIKRVTAAPRLEYFSEYMAMFWQLETIFGRSNNSRSQQNKADQHIVSGLHFDIDEDTKKAVMPLLRGVSNMVREAYHRAPEKTDVLKAALWNITQHNLFSQHHRLKGDHPKKEELDIIERYLGEDHSELEMAKEHLYDPLALANMVDDPLNNWALHAFNGTAFLGSELGRQMADQLEEHLDRDIPQKIKDQLADVIGEGLELKRLTHIMDAAVHWRMMNAELPPLPDDFDATARHPHLTHRYAVMETVKAMPIEMITLLLEKADNASRGRADMDLILSDLPPTEMGRSAGLSNLNVNEHMAESEDPQLRTWRADYAGIVLHGYVDTPSWETVRDLMTYTKELSPAAERQAAQLHPNTGLHLLKAHEALTSRLGDYIGCAGHMGPSPGAIERAYYKTDHGAYEDAPRERLAPDSEVWDRLLSEKDPEVFQRLAPDLRRHSQTCFALLAQAHVRSETNDGTIASLCKTLSDPGSLSPFPDGLLTYLRDYAQRIAGFSDEIGKNAHDDNYLLSYVSDQARIAIRSDIPSAFAAAVARHLDNFNKRDVSNGVWKYLADATDKALGDKDMSGIKALDKAARDGTLVSMRYQTNDENREMFSRFMPRRWQDTAFEALSPAEMKAQTKSLPYIDPNQVDDPVQRFDYALALLRHTSLEEAANSAPRRSSPASRELRSLQRAKRNVATMAGGTLPSRVVSHFLRESVAFEGAHITESGRTNAKNKKYWSQTREVFARMMEKTVHETLERQGEPNPFLVTVPSNKRQSLKLKPMESSLEKRLYGNHYDLVYPATSELDSMVKCFNDEVVPNMEPALKALYPDSIPHYEAYRKAQDLAAEDAKVERQDIDHDSEPLAPQGTPRARETVPADEIPQDTADPQEPPASAPSPM